MERDSGGWGGKSGPLASVSPALACFNEQLLEGGMYYSLHRWGHPSQAEGGGSALPRACQFYSRGACAVSGAGRGHPGLCLGTTWHRAPHAWSGGPIQVTNGLLPPQLPIRTHMQ